MQATGVVFERVGPRGTESGGHTDTYHVTVRVNFGDESTTEPVRYDSSDHSKIEIDVPELEARKENARNESRLRSVARAEAALNEQPVAGLTAEEIRNRPAGDTPTLAQIRNARNNASN